MKLYNVWIQDRSTNDRQQIFDDQGVVVTDDDVDRDVGVFGFEPLNLPF